jgi:hypothetical protein
MKFLVPRPDRRPWFAPRTHDCRRPSASTPSLMVWLHRAIGLGSFSVPLGSTVLLVCGSLARRAGTVGPLGKHLVMTVPPVGAPLHPSDHTTPHHGTRTALCSAVPVGLELCFPLRPAFGRQAWFACLKFLQPSSALQVLRAHCAPASSRLLLMVVHTPLRFAPWGLPTPRRHQLGTLPAGAGVCGECRWTEPPSCRCPYSAPPPPPSALILLQP